MASFEDRKPVNISSYKLNLETTATIDQLQILHHPTTILNSFDKLN